MNYGELVLDTTALNLAVDEWMLETAEQSHVPIEFVRLWENPVPAVVLGRSSRFDEEVDEAFCREHGIGITRRVSGGASVVVGPGCLMYSVVLDYRLRPQLRMLDAVHEFVMQRLQHALSRCGVDCEFEGTCDLTLANRKVSGNSLRCCRNACLYHGTLLYDFPLPLISGALRRPPRQPDYRQGRSHADFVANLNVPRSRLVSSLKSTWLAEALQEPVPGLDCDPTAIESLARHRYNLESWTRKR